MVTTVALPLMTIVTPCLRKSFSCVRRRNGPTLPARMLETLELDHVFVCAPRAAEDAALLEEAGLHCGMNRIHTGQGTANANFYFDNAYLEVLWLRDEAEVRSSLVAPLALWQRLNSQLTGACPFGVGFRASSPAVVSQLSSWTYSAPYFPPDSGIPIVTSSGSELEPLVFFPVGGTPPTLSIEQKGKRRKLKKVHIETPTGLLSTELGKLMETGLLTITQGQAYQMELEFEAGLECEVLDFRPALPLLIRW